MHVRKKLLELEKSREKLEQTETKLSESKHRENQMGAEIAQIRAYNESLRSDIEKLNAVVVAEKGLTVRQSQELSRWQETVTVMRAEVGQLKAEGKRADALQQANEELNNELNSVRNFVDEERSELRKSVASLNAQLEQTINDKNEVSRHFWNLTEDTKSLKEDLENSKSAVQELTSKSTESETQNNAFREMSEAREKSLMAELEQVRSTIDQAVLQASKQKEIEMRNEFKDMLERMGGMQEQAEMTRDELSNLESERNQLIQQLNKQKSTTENVTQQLRDERQKSDGAALEIATLQQNMDGLR